MAGLQVATEVLNLKVSSERPPQELATKLLDRVFVISYSSTVYSWWGPIMGEQTPPHPRSKAVPNGVAYVF
jgi:hypothetical protein